MIITACIASDYNCDVRRCLPTEPLNPLTAFRLLMRSRLRVGFVASKVKMLYQEGWTCFNPNCRQFCRRPASSILAGMTYTPEFLRHRELRALPLNKEQWRLTPDPPPTSETNPIITTKEFAKGWWCSRSWKVMLQVSTKMICEFQEATAELELQGAMGILVLFVL